MTIKVRNATTNKILSEKVIVLKTFAEKSKGMLAFNTPTAVFFETRWGIHTFGMKYAIDVVVLNKGKQIVAIKKNLTTRRCFFWNPRYKLVLEFPAGTEAKEGDYLEIL